MMNNIVAGHVFRPDWHNGLRCWCHDRPISELARTTRRYTCARCGETFLPGVDGHSEDNPCS